MSKSRELTPVQTVACCSPLTSEPLSAEQAERIAPLVKALADPVRLRLLSLVASHADGEACVCDLNDAFDLSQPTISHHLKVLHDVGLLDRRSGACGCTTASTPPRCATSVRCSAPSPDDEPTRRIEDTGWRSARGRRARRHRVPRRRRDRLRDRRHPALARRRRAAAPREQPHRGRPGRADPGAAAGVGLVQPRGDASSSGRSRDDPGRARPRARAGRRRLPRRPGGQPDVRPRRRLGRHARADRRGPLAREVVATSASSSWCSAACAPPASRPWPSPSAATSLRRTGSPAPPASPTPR